MQKRVPLTAFAGWSLRLSLIIGLVGCGVSPSSSAPTPTSAPTLPASRPTRTPIAAALSENQTGSMSIAEQERPDEPQGQAPRPDGDRFEPDDSQNNSRPIGLNEIQDRTFHLPTDVDWLRIATQPETIYRLRTFDLSDDTDTVITLYDLSGNQLAYNDDGGDAGYGSQISFAGTSDGELFLEVRQFDNEADEAASRAYRIELTTINPAPPDQYEADDNLDSAKSLALGETQRHTIHRPDDRDWVAVSVEAGQIYRFATFDLEGDLDTVLTLYNEDNREVARNDDGGTDGVASQIIYQAEISTTLYLEVSLYNNGAFDRRWAYQLIAERFTPEPADQFEPDDIPDSAKPLALGERQVRNFHLPTDVDWALVELEAGVTYIFETLNLENGIDTILVLYDLEEAELARADDGSEEPLASRLEFLAERSGTYLLYVEKYNANRFAPGWNYTLTFNTQEYVAKAQGRAQPK